MSKIVYSTSIPGNGHWSLEVKRGTLMRITDTEGGANLGMLFYNPRNLLERYNAPDTLKCQHTFKLQKGNCLYSDMGRIFASIVEDTSVNGAGNWHDTICGSSNAAQIESRWGKRDYQKNRNDWLQNGTDAFLVELAKYGLSRADMAANRVAGQALREQVSELFVQPEVDAVAAEALRQQMLAQHDRRSQRMMQAMLELSQVLTPEQRQQWVTTMQTQRSAMQNLANRRGQGADRVPGRLHRHGVDGAPPGAQSGAASS